MTMCSMPLQQCWSAVTCPGRAEKKWCRKQKVVPKKNGRAKKKVVPKKSRAEKKKFVPEPDVVKKKLDEKN